MRPSADCQISKPRVSQLSLSMLVVLNVALPYVVGYYAVYTYAFIYGFFYGGYLLSLKLYLYEIARPRHFCFLWSIIQLVQGKYVKFKTTTVNVLQLIFFLFNIMYMNLLIK